MGHFPLSLPWGLCPAAPALAAGVMSVWMVCPLPACQGRQHSGGDSLDMGIVRLRRLFGGEQPWPSVVWSCSEPVSSRGEESGGDPPHPAQRALADPSEGETASNAETGALRSRLPSSCRTQHTFFFFLNSKSFKSFFTSQLQLAFNIISVSGDNTPPN